MGSPQMVMWRGMARLNDIELGVLIGARLVGNWKVGYTLTLDEHAGVTKESPSSASGLEGVGVQGIEDELQSEFLLDAEIEGVVVTRVSPSSKAAAGGIRPRDVIAAIDRRPMKNAADFDHLMKGAQNDAIFVQVKRYVPDRGLSNFFFGVER